MDQQVADYSVKVVFGALILLTILAIVCLRIKEVSSGLKKILYSLIVLTTVLSTGFLAFSTIALNTSSSSGGPVHWHADYEIWACDQEVIVAHSNGLSNKVGTATLHSHDDQRIHQEGVVYHREDASLGKYFEAIGGQISRVGLTVPTDKGMLSYKTGESCPDGKRAQVQAFVYQVQGKNYHQKKLIDPENYVISSQSGVPPGDCIIIEYGPPKLKTDKFCRSYKVAKQIDKLGDEQ